MRTSLTISRGWPTVMPYRSSCRASRSSLAAWARARTDAYFEETKVPQIKAGSAVKICLMNGGAILQGRVESIARGITDQDNRDGPELLATVNPTFTWVRLAQRIPRLTDVPEDMLRGGEYSRQRLNAYGETPMTMVVIERH